MENELKQIGFYCEHKHACKWHGVGSAGGFHWGLPQDTLAQWREWHARQCGGAFVPVYEKVR